MDKIKEIERKIKLSEYKDLNNIPGGDEDFTEAIEMFLSGAPQTRLKSERVIRWQQELPKSDNIFEDLSALIGKLFAMNNELKKEKDIDRLCDNIEDLLCLYGYIISGQECTLTQEPDLLDPVYVDLHENIQSAIEKTTSYIEKAIADLQKAIKRKDSGLLSIYGFCYSLVIISDVAAVKHINKKEKSL